ncbi:UNVERIFIED_CONTAM: hypothetical protein FKN15_030296 [Acipenser sinensis]
MMAVGEVIPAGIHSLLAVGEVIPAGIHPLLVEGDPAGIHPLPVKVAEVEAAPAVLLLETEKNGYSGPCVPRKRVILTKLGGGVKSSFEKPEDYYRTEILFSTLDTLIEEVEDRFSENDLFIFKSLADVLSSESPSDESVGAVSTTYSIDQEDLNSEINLFSRMFKDGISDKSNEEEERTQLEKRLRFFREMQHSGYPY